VSADGIPTGNLAWGIYKIHQVAHSFTKVGQPASFDGTNWTLARADTNSTLAQAVVKEILDADNFVLQVGGSIENLDSTAFAGGTIQPGTVYYVSSSVAGQLTSAPPASPGIANPVLFTLAGTSGFVLSWEPGGSGSGTSGEDLSQLDVNQVGHGYTSNDVGAPVRYDGTNWVKAQADTAGNIQQGVIMRVIDTDHFTVQFDGVLSGIHTSVNGGSPLVPGSVYRLSPTNAGQVQPWVGHSS